MNRRDLLLGGLSLALASALPDDAWSQKPPGKAKQPRKKRVLLFTKSSGYEHSVVKPDAKGTSLVERTFTDLATKGEFELTASKDGSIFTPERISSFDGFVFFTSGDLTQAGTDKNPPMTAEGKQVFLDAVRNGKGFIGIHSAADTFHTQPDPPDLSERYENHGIHADAYIQMLGGEFLGHGEQQKAKLIVPDKDFPGMKDFPDKWELTEEWYSMKEFPPDLHVLLVQDTAGMKGSFYERRPYPSTWAKQYSRGKVFYTSLGHREETWADPLFLAMLGGAFQWVLGDPRVFFTDITPNLKDVAPGYADFPPKPAKMG
ncbi:MAG TPA: ThuA domain-containing protein [Terriglobales bacterium]|nr:ThuA domain-containing protein [Terriglobales bacterium]